MPYVFLADDAFRLGKHCLIHFSQSGLTPIKRIINYRLSRERRVTENALCLDDDKATIITLATLLLHNMLCQLSQESYTPEGYIDAETEGGDIVKGGQREENVGASVLQSLPKSNTQEATKHGQHKGAFANHF